MRNNYPPDYTGPRAGVSDNDAWASVTEYQAFKHIKFEDWTYADFDCWLGVREEQHHERGKQSVMDALKEMQKLVGINTLQDTIIQHGNL